MFSFFSFDSLVVILQLLFVCTCVCARDRFAFEAPMVNLICKSDKRLSFKPRKMTARCADEKAPWGNWRLWRKTVWLSAEHSQVFLLHHFRHLLSFLWLCQLWKKKKCQKLKKYPPPKKGSSIFPILWCTPGSNDALNLPPADSGMAQQAIGLTVSGICLFFFPLLIFLDFL